MAAIRIRTLPDGEIGPFGGPFAVEWCGGDPKTVASVVQFVQWVAGGMSWYGNKGGLEDSSLFKSYTAECFEELARDLPEVASHLTGLVVV